MRTNSPLSGRYLVRRPLANRCLALVDTLLARLAGDSLPSCPPSPHGILLCNGAHLGDVVLSTAMLAPLRSAFPQARIGFLVGSWSRDVVARHPLVDRIHVVDHWKLSRRPVSMAAKMRRYLTTRASALRGIRRVGYDVAIDLYPYFPNSIPLLWQAGIPVRIGYTSGGFGPLLTHPHEWRVSERHILDYQADLMRALPHFTTEPLRPMLGGLAAKEGDALRKRLGLMNQRYLVLHMGAGSPHKEWPAAQWRELASALSRAGWCLAFTGAGRRERGLAEDMVRAVPSAINLCGRLGWQEFVTVVQEADLLIGVDSVAGHVAAGVGTPFVVIATGITPRTLWAPRGAGRVLAHAVSCSPCYQSAGCDDMDCVRGVLVADVLQAVHEMLAPATRVGA